MMERTINLKIVTYILNGINQGKSYLKYICDICDIIFIQEHWLAFFDLDMLNSVCGNMFKLVKSAARCIILQFDQTILINIYLSCLSVSGLGLLVMQCK